MKTGQLQATTFGGDFMFSQKHIDGFEKYWQQRKPGIHTAVHYASDPGIFSSGQLTFHP
jgi:hypothetical protein